MKKLLTFAMSLAIGWAGLSTSARAADPNAITDPAKVDQDFAYQGEYLGDLQTASGMRHTGLQVIARGGGQFEAVRYEGGLPGLGWEREQPQSKLVGDLQGSMAILVGDGVTVRIDGQKATFLNKAGKTMGVLEKRERLSPTLGATPPASALVLFDGKSTKHLEGARVTKDGLLQEGFTTKQPVGDFRLHLEFRLPYMPKARGQGRGNSGVYIQRRYEVQILDSFGLEGVANECGGLYRQQQPDVNMCLPPLTWQTYDIWFQAAKWDKTGKKKTANARLTVLHNGVPIHNDRNLPTKTGAGKPESPEKLPILFQNHRDPVRFRNMWIVLGDGKPPVDEVSPSDVVPPKKGETDAGKVHSDQGHTGEIVSGACCGEVVVEATECGGCAIEIPCGESSGQRCRLLLRLRSRRCR